MNATLATELRQRRIRAGLRRNDPIWLHTAFVEAAVFTMPSVTLEKASDCLPADRSQRAMFDADMALSEDRTYATIEGLAINDLDVLGTVLAGGGKVEASEYEY
jgi:hypothetical protein